MSAALGGECPRPQLLTTELPTTPSPQIVSKESLWARQQHEPLLAFTFEVLYRSFVLFRPFPRVEGAEIFSLAGLRIYLPRIEPVLTGFQFSDHCRFLPLRLRNRAAHKNTLRDSGAASRYLTGNYRSKIGSLIGQNFESEMLKLLNICSGIHTLHSYYEGLT